MKFRKLGSPIKPRIDNVLPFNTEIPLSLSLYIYIYIYIHKYICVSLRCAQVWMVRAKLCGCVRQRVSKRWAGQLPPTVRKGFYGTFLKTHTNDNQVNPSARMNSCESVYIRMSQWFNVESKRGSFRQRESVWTGVKENGSEWIDVRHREATMSQCESFSESQCESVWIKEYKSVRVNVT